MKLTRLRLTKEASNRLRFVAGKTGLTPNLLCRIGFCLSLAEPTLPNPADYPEEDREFNRYTLLGEYDPLFVAVLKERCRRNGVSVEVLPEHFRAC
jgi:DNA sulfur modification protein DndE